MPKYQIEREGQTFSTFFSFFFYPSNQISTTTKKIDPDLDAKKNLKGASSVKKKQRILFLHLKQKKKAREVLSKQKNNNFSLLILIFLFFDQKANALKLCFRLGFLLNLS